jgi:chromate reductase
MSQINIAVIVGSLRRESYNAKLAQAIGKLAPARSYVQALVDR